MCQCSGWVGLACLRVFSILCIDPPPHNCSQASPGQWVVCCLEMIWIIHPESFLRTTICIPLLFYHLSPSLMPLLWTLSGASHYWCHWWLSGSRQKESKSLLVFFVYKCNRTVLISNIICCHQLAFDTPQTSFLCCEIKGAIMKFWLKLKYMLIWCQVGAEMFDPVHPIQVDGMWCWVEWRGRGGWSV